MANQGHQKCPIFLEDSFWLFKLSVLLSAIVLFRCENVIEGLKSDCTQAAQVRYSVPIYFKVNLCFSVIRRTTHCNVERSLYLAPSNRAVSCFVLPVVL